MFSRRPVLLLALSFVALAAAAAPKHFLELPNRAESEAKAQAFQQLMLQGEHLTDAELGSRIETFVSALPAENQRLFRVQKEAQEAARRAAKAKLPELEKHLSGEALAAHRRLIEVSENAALTVKEKRDRMLALTSPEQLSEPAYQELEHIWFPNAPPRS